MKTLQQMLDEARTHVETVDPQTAAAELAAGTSVLIDVREPVEWEHHIAGAIQIPRGLLEFAADPASPRYNPELEPTGNVIVYCHSGTRASLAVMTLKELGYQHVTNLEGGITAWTAAGFPTVAHHDGI